MYLNDGCSDVFLLQDGGVILSTVGEPRGVIVNILNFYNHESLVALAGRSSTASPIVRSGHVQFVRDLAFVHYSD